MILPALIPRSGPDKNVGRKFEALAQSSHLLQSEFALSRKQYGDRIFRAEFRSQVALRDPDGPETNHGNGIALGIG